MSSPSTADSYRIRTADTLDAATIAHQRVSMFVDLGNASAEEYEPLRNAMEPWISGMLASGQYVGWIVETDGKAVAGGGAFLLELGPARAVIGPEIGRISLTFTPSANTAGAVSRGASCKRSLTGARPTPSTT